MLILALESSSLVASVALMNEENLIAEYTTNQKKTHSQTLLPMINELFSNTGIDKKTIDAIAISGGPGSFTGLRIGSATAKGLALALDKPIVNIPTIDGMAYNIHFSDKLICPIMDARRNQVYTGIYKNNEKFECILEQCALSVEELIDHINLIGKDVIFIGDGIPVYREIIDKSIRVPHFYAPNHMSRQRAGSIAGLAIEYYKVGKVENPDNHIPNYLRLSQAERERKQNDKKDDSQ